MKKFKLIALVMIAALCLPALADETKAVQARIQSAMNQVCAAMKRKDITTITNIIKANFAKDFTKTVGGKKESLNNWLANMKQQMAGVQSVQRCDLKLSSLKISGDTASGTETFNVTMTVPNPSTAKKTSVIKVQSVSTGTYAKVGGKWMVKSSMQKSAKTWMDGKLLGG